MNRAVAARRPSGRRLAADHYADRPMSAPVRFDPGSFRTFRIVGRDYDPASRTVTLRYALDDRVAFAETVTFETPPDARAGTAGPSGPGFERALLHLHVAAGTSYYKTAAPERSWWRGSRSTRSSSTSTTTSTTRGCASSRSPTACRCPVRSPWCRAGGWPDGRRRPAGGLRPGLLVPIGGGKDSMVLIEAVRHLGAPAVRRQPAPAGLRAGGRGRARAARRPPPARPGTRRPARSRSPERTRAHHRHRVADRRRRCLRPRLRHRRHGRRAVGQRGDDVGRRRAGQPPVLEEPGVRAAAGRRGADHRRPRVHLRLGPASVLGARHRPGLRRPHPLPRHVLQL